MLERIRKGTIVTFIIFHLIALIFWVFPPYSAAVLDEPKPNDIIPLLERHLFSGLQHLQTTATPRLFNAYIDLIGMHQYWDFFAPNAPTQHRYLRVCKSITQHPESNLIDCGTLLYKSYHGKLADTIKPHLGRRSRSFRLTENLTHLRRADLLEAFTRHWTLPDQQNPEIYLVVSEFALNINQENDNDTPQRYDEVIWLWP